MNARNAPRAAVPDWRDRVSTAVSVGPMHGVQPMPNSTPSSGAPASPALGIADGLNIRPANMNRSNAPKNSSPSRIVTPPSTRVSVESCALNSCPSPPTASPARENTAEKPTTNSAARARARVATPPPEAASASPSAATGFAPAFAVPVSASAASGAAVASAPDMPVMYARYPGTSGRQHGERKVTAPAAAATGMASSSGPDDTRLTTDMPPSMADAGRLVATAGVAKLPAVLAAGPVAAGHQISLLPCNR